MQVLFIIRGYNLMEFKARYFVLTKLWKVKNYHRISIEFSGSQFAKNVKFDKLQLFKWESMVQGRETYNNNFDKIEKIYFSAKELQWLPIYWALDS